MFPGFGARFVKTTTDLSAPLLCQIASAGAHGYRFPVIRDALRGPVTAETDANTLIEVIRAEPMEWLFAPQGS